MSRNFPASSFEEALEFAKAIFKIGSGSPVRRLTLFNEIGKSPESSASRLMITNASKYGLTSGGYQAEQLQLTPDGLRAIDEEGSVRERIKARVKLAIEDIEVFKGLYDHFMGNKLPARAVLIDAAKELGVQPDAVSEAVDTFIVNLKFVGLLQTLSGAERIVTVDHLLDSVPATSQSLAPISTVAVSKEIKSLVTAEHAHFETTCFYVAPIGDSASDLRKHSDLFLGSIVEPAVEPFKLSVIRADAIDKPGVITKQIIEYLLKSRLVIVDLSHHNPNVFYELAIRHMMRLPVVQIIRQADRVPFDINQMRTIIIDDSDVYSLVPKIESYRSEISTQIRRALEDPDSVDNPITTYYPALKAALN
ncbi:MAG: hypothetical protein EKK36_12670 [Bradyrhizobiaceae bacterium]|nr:MAG: hypothetical protein EKK36_12670 [Bradyrhizobiaceae bacterium]